MTNETPKLTIILTFIMLGLILAFTALAYLGSSQRHDINRAYEQVHGINN